MSKKLPSNHTNEALVVHNQPAKGNTDKQYHQRPKLSSIVALKLLRKLDEGASIRGTLQTDEEGMLKKSV